MFVPFDASFTFGEEAFDCFLIEDSRVSESDATEVLF
jgi:hypothetical protein